MTDETKKPQAGHSTTDVPKPAPEGEARAAESREKISAALDKHKGEIQKIIDLLREHIFHPVFPSSAAKRKLYPFVRIPDHGPKDIKEIVKIKQSLPAEIDLRHFPGYMEAVKASFLHFLRKGQAEEALKIRQEFGGGIDFGQSREYKPVFSAFREKHYPDFGNYLASKEADESLVTKYRNEFWAKNPRDITPKLLLKFESLVVSADGFMRKAMKDKVRSFGADPERPDWAEKLTEGQKGEVGAFMDNLQTQVRAKLQTIASAEVINAYRDRDGGGMGWMEAAA